MTCGWVGKVSEIEWTFIGRRGNKDVYRFTRRFPVNKADSPKVQKEVEFDGRRIKIFESDAQRIVIESPKKHPATALNVKQAT